MYQNWNSFCGSIDSQGNVTLRVVGAETYPMKDQQGADFTQSGATVEPTVTDAPTLAAIKAALVTAAQSVATRDAVSVRLNGADTQYDPAT